MEVQSIQSPQQCSVPSFTGSGLLSFGYIFSWGVPRGVRLTTLKVTIPDPSHFRQMLKISLKTWSASQRVLKNHCSDMLGDLIRKADIAQSAIAARSRVRTRSTKGTPYTPSRLGRDSSTHAKSPKNQCSCSPPYATQICQSGCWRKWERSIEWHYCRPVFPIVSETTSLSCLGSPKAHNYDRRGRTTYSVAICPT